MTIPDDPLTRSDREELYRIRRAEDAGVARAGNYDPGTLQRLSDRELIVGVSVQVAPTPSDIAGMLTAPSEIMVQTTEAGRALLKRRAQ